MNRTALVSILLSSVACASCGNKATHTNAPTGAHAANPAAAKLAPNPASMVDPNASADSNDDNDYSQEELAFSPKKPAMECPRFLTGKRLRLLNFSTPDMPFEKTDTDIDTTGEVFPECFKYRKKNTDLLLVVGEGLGAPENTRIQRMVLLTGEGKLVAADNTHHHAEHGGESDYYPIDLDGDGVDEVVSRISYAHMDSEDESIVVRKLAGAKLVSVTRAGTKGDFWIGISRSNDNEQCHAKVVAFVPLKDSSTEIQILRPRQTTQQCAESEVWSLKNGSLVHRLESRPRDISERSSDRNIRQ